MYSLLISALADNLANLIIYPLSLSTDQVYLLLLSCIYLTYAISLVLHVSLSGWFTCCVHHDV